MIKDLRTEFKYKLLPLKHQEEGFIRSREEPHFALWWEMGTMKSKVMIDTASWLFLKQEIDGVLIISDKGAYLNWVDVEIPKHIPDNIPHELVAWSSTMKSKQKERVDKIMTPRDDVLDILCMNVEAFSGGRAMDIAWKFIKSHYVLMIIDESTSIKNLRAERTKTLIMLGRHCDYRRCLTGTPITNSPLDVFAQCEFLKDQALGFRSFVAFRSHYAIMERQYLGPNRPSFDKVVGFKNLKELTDSMSLFSSRLLKSECLDLPEKVYETIHVEWTPEQAGMYTSLKKTAILQLEQGLLSSTSAITTINKLHQINCGHVKLDDGVVVDISSNRVSSLLDVLEKIMDHKVLIWCRFQRDVELIFEAIKEKFNEIGYYPIHYYGKTADWQRKENLQKFELDNNCKWFVGTAATGGKSLTLIQADYTIYYSCDYNLEDRLQSEDRNHRYGQKNSVTYIDMVVKDTIDESILNALIRKEDLASEVLDKFRQLI